MGYVRTEPNWRDGRLLHLLSALLELILRLAHARLVLLGELEVCPPLLRCLGLWVWRLAVEISEHNVGRTIVKVCGVECAVEKGI